MLIVVTRNSNNCMCACCGRSQEEFEVAQAIYKLRCGAAYSLAQSCHVGTYPECDWRQGVPSKGALSWTAHQPRRSHALCAFSHTRRLGTRSTRPMRWGGQMMWVTRPSSKPRCTCRERGREGGHVERTLWKSAG